MSMYVRLDFSSLNDFEHLQLIQTTLFGALWKAFHPVSKQWVAIKKSSRYLLDSHVSIHAQMVNERPDKEFQILSKFHHPSIVSCLGEFSDHLYHYLVYEYIDGKELFTWLEQNFVYMIRMQINRMAHHIFQQLVQVLVYLHHQHKMAHLDLSLENIMIVSHSKIKVIDFGQIYDYGHEKQIPFTWPFHLPYGKPMYLSPELIAEKMEEKNLHTRFYPEAADVFQLGIVLFSLLTGHHPFDQASVLKDTRYRMIQNKKLDEYLKYYHIHLTVDQQKEEKENEEKEKEQNEMIDLLQQMMEFDPCKRITLHDIQHHPWFLRKYNYEEEEEEEEETRIKKSTMVSST